jgi:hypothetical protein
LSNASPTLPIDTSTPDFRKVRPKSIDVYWDAVIAVMDRAVPGPALLQRHADRVEDEFAAEMIGHRPATTRRLQASTTAR